MNSKSREYRLLLGFLSFSISFLCFAISSSQAQISVDRVIVSWTKEMPPVLNVTVRNSADEPMLVSVEPTESTRPGEKDEKLVESQDLLAAPKRLSVPALGARTVRLLYRGKRGDLERVFRVSFRPTARDDSEDTGPAPKVSKSSLNIKILTGVGILIFMEPLEPKPEFAWDKTDHSVILRNSGNVNILVDHIMSCDAAGQNCEKPKPKRLYPGMQYQFPAVPGGKITLRKRILGEATDIELN